MQTILDDESISESEFRGSLPWFALQVRARRELGISDQLRSLGYEWFLPLYSCKKRWSDRTKTVQLPLFPGYIFCRFDPLNRLPILKIPGVIQVVGFNRQPVPIDQDEIRAIQVLVASGLPHKPWPYLKVGDKVRIEAGPLCGLEGSLTEFQGDRQLVLSVTLLRRSVAVKIDSTSVTLLRQGTEPRETEMRAISCGM
ncbi:MAG: UpxY family transcription antiterminator [Candidatus Acidiferrales bacterium]